MDDEKTDFLWKLILSRALDMLQSQFGYNKNQALAIVSKAMWIAFKSNGGGCFITSENFIKVLACLIRHRFN